MQPARTVLSALRGPAARPRRMPQQRFASSTPSSSSSSSEAAQKKAQAALEGAKKFGASVGERVGNLLGSYRQPIVYNLSVGRELLKQVYIAERLQPPTSLSQVQAAYSTIWSRASNPTYWREIVKTGEWAKIGVYAVEAYGIFKIGEILGRRNLVGYHLE